MASAELYQARVDDYHSDDSDGARVVPDSLPRKASPSAQANVSTKRSKDLNADKAPVLEKMAPSSDMRSDSGYSSVTAASKSSADSAPSASSRSPPAAPAVAAPPASQSPAPKARRQTTVGGEARQHSNESSPRQSHKPLSRTASVSSKPQRPAHQRRPTVSRERRDTKTDTKDAECRDPNYTDYAMNTLPHRRRPDLQQTASTRNVAGYPSETMSQRSDPNPYYSPPSPVYNRQPAPYASQGPAVVQTARTRRSSSTAAGTRPRPQSFAGDPSNFWAPGMPAPYPSPPQEHGPPPSFSAYQNMQNMPNMQHMQYSHNIPPYMGGQQGAYYPQQGQQFDPQQRPQMSARGSSSYGRSKPPPVVTQDDTSKYSARYGQPPTPSEQHYKRGPNTAPPGRRLLQYGDAIEDSQSESESESSEEDEPEVRQPQVRATRALMPPPKMKREQSQRRPALTHAKTTQVVERLENDRRDKRRQSIVVPDRAVPRERQRERAPTVSASSSRRPSVSRPPVHRSTQSEYDTRQARIVVNDSRNNRRKSYQVYDKPYDEFARDRAAEEQYKAERQREKRASRVIMHEQHIPGQYEDDDDESEEEAPRVLPHRQRAKTESDPRKAKPRTVDVRNKKAELSAEEYINATRGSRDPYADQINKAALKRVSRKPSVPSESGSSQSNESGRASQSNRTTMTSATNNEIRLRVDGTVPLSLQLSGDMEGRTLQLVPAENGMTDLVIGGGNARDNETVYRSERGTVQVNNNRRSLIAGQGRRDAEDASERSTRSARSRRDWDEIREVRDERAPILRRSRPTTTYRN